MSSDVRNPSAQALEAASRLRRVVVPLARQLRQSDTQVFTPTQVSVIGTILRHGPITIGGLASRERLSLPTVSKVVAAVEAAGVIERISDAQDRRISRVQVTASGEQLIERGRAARNHWLAERIGSLSPSDRATLGEALPVLERLIGEDR